VIENYQVCSVQYCVCNSCAQCNAYTYEQPQQLFVCWLDLALLWLYFMLQFTCVRFSFLGLFCFKVHLCVRVCVCLCGVRFKPWFHAKIKLF